MEWLLRNGYCAAHDEAHPGALTCAHAASFAAPHAQAHAQARAEPDGGSHFQPGTVVDTGGFFPKDGKTRLTHDLRLTLDQTKYMTVTAEEMLMNFARVLNQGKNKSDELTNKPDATCGGGPRVLNSKA